MNEIGDGWPDSVLEPGSWNAAASVELHARLLATVHERDADAALKAALIAAIECHTPIVEPNSDANDWARCASCLNGGDTPDFETHPCEEITKIGRALGVSPRPVVVEGQLSNRREPESLPN